MKTLTIPCCIFFLAGCLHTISSIAQHLKVGDVAPTLQVYEWIKGDPGPKFRKGRWYVLEFGATWCTPCRQAIPKLTTLAKKYPDRLTVIGLHVMEPNFSPPNAIPSFVSRVKKFVRQQGELLQYSVGVDDADKTLEKTWVAASGKNSIPLAFIIDPDSRVAWMGSNTDALIKTIEDYIRDGKHQYTRSSERIEDTGKVLPDNVLFASSFDWYQPGQKKVPFMTYIDSFQWAKAGTPTYEQRGMVQVTGQPMRRLYYMAYADTLDNMPLENNPITREYPDTVRYPHLKSSYGRYWYRPILELEDSTIFDLSLSRNRFNYFLKVPPAVGTAKFLQEAMRRDLQTYTGYKVTVEERMMPCWKIVTNEKGKRRLPAKEEGKSRVEIDDHGNHHFRNAVMQDVVFQLEILYGYNQHGLLDDYPESQPPFFDATGITGEINFTLVAEDVRKLTDAFSNGESVPFDEYRKMLGKSGLVLVKSTRKMKVIVIRDADPAN